MTKLSQKPYALKRNYGTRYALPLAVWVSLFFVIPIGIILMYSLLTRDTYGGVKWQFSLEAFAALANPAFAKVAVSTLWIAVVSTLLTILVALPCSYYMARSKNNTMLLFFVIIPFWVNFLIRVYAWMAVLGQQGFINDFLLATGLVKEPVKFLYNQWAVIIVHVYTYIPYAILPLFSTIEKFDFSLLEAARDLGASHSQSLRKVMLPNIRSGIITAVLFTLVPTFGSYAIPELVGGADSYMLGNVIANQLLVGRNWPLASSISVVITLITSVGLLLYLIYNRQAEKALIQQEDN
jgi:spermidine/putrescine transport system permease protein